MGFVKICVHCNKEFIAKCKTTKFCSQSCGSKHRWEDKEYQQRMRDKRNTPESKKKNSDAQKIVQNRPEVKAAKSKFQKEYQNRPEIRKKNSDAQKIAQNKPEVKNAKSERMKIIANDPEVKQKFQEWSKEYHNRPENKEKNSQRTKEYYNEHPEARIAVSERIKKYYAETYPTDYPAQERRRAAAKEYVNRPGVKKHLSILMKKYWMNPINRELQSERQKIAQNRPDVKEKNIISSLQLWKDPVYANKILKRSFKYKDYELPSGRIVKVQGYEPQVLSTLLKTHKEEDIIIGVKEMNKEIGRIKYIYKNRERTYYPDFYIKSLNKIIEVKSQWTFDLHKEKNLAKEQACLQQGFDFEFVIL